MLGDLFHEVIYVPLYNALVALLSMGDWVDVGIAVILLTVLVKLILAPLSLKAARTQILMRDLEAPMREIRERYTDKQEQGRKMLELYRERGVNPFSGIASLFIQIPIILGLYFVFLKGGLPTIDTDALYGFIPVPAQVDMFFLGLVDMAGKSYFLAVLAGVSQYWQAHIALPVAAPRSENPTFQEDFTRTMQLQMRYVLPVFIVFVAYVASAAVALYWITSNICTILQELYAKRKLRSERDTQTHA